MKKSKLSVGLVTSFIAAMALTACGGSVSKGKENILDLTGYDDKALQVVTQDIYDDYKHSASGISQYYDAVIEVLIRNVFDKSQKDATVLPGIKKNYNRIVSEARDSVKEAKQSAKENAETNGTTFAKEWESILTQQGVKDEKELLEHYIYNLEKEEIEDWYFEQNKESLKQEYLGVTKTGETVNTVATSRFPYHVRHILIKADVDSSEQFTRGTITADQAKALGNTISLLADGKMSFGKVAELKSEDTSSTSYGDVGIMTTAISSGKLGMVNEFQLGIYAYDAIVKNAAKSNAVVDKGLGLDKPSEEGGDEANTVKKFFTDRKIAEVPYSVFMELLDVAEIENNKDNGWTIEGGKAALYPRNLLWNRYLNNHSIFVITNGSRPTSGDIHGTTDDVIDPVSADTYYTGTNDPYVNSKGENINYDQLTRLAANDKFTGTNERVLQDERGNVIIGVRSEFGIHLMIVEKSAYDFDGEVSLNDYYTTAVPGDSDYPTKEVGGKKVDLQTYVNFINTVSKSEYTTRADAVKSAIKGFDSTYDYRLYKLLAGENKDDPARTAKFSGEETLELLTLIDDYIELQREKNKEEQKDGIEDVWQTYVSLLTIQDHYRKTLKRALPEGCKIAFSGDTNYNDDPAFKEGGRCYVK